MQIICFANGKRARNAMLAAICIFLFCFSCTGWKMAWNTCNKIKMAFVKTGFLGVVVALLRCIVVHSLRIVFIENFITQRFEVFQGISHIWFFASFLHPKSERVHQKNVSRGSTKTAKSFRSHKVVKHLKEIWKIYVAEQVWKRGAKVFFFNNAEFIVPFDAQWFCVSGTDS